MIIHPTSHKKWYLFDKCLAFGSSISCALFQQFSDAVEEIFYNRTRHHSNNYLDDFLFVALMQLICNHWRIQGAPRRPPPPPPPTGSISFIFAYIFAEKCMHRRLAPPKRVGAPPTGNPRSATGNDFVNQFLQICEEINFPVALEKTFWATQIIIFLGMILNTITQTILIL